MHSVHDDVCKGELETAKCRCVHTVHIDGTQMQEITDAGLKPATYSTCYQVQLC